MNALKSSFKYHTAAAYCLFFSCLVVTNTQAVGPVETTVCDYSSCSQVQLTLTAAPTSQGFSTSQVLQVVEDILQVSGLAPNFEVVVSPEVGNAAALIRQEQRYLAYNKQWMNSLEGDAMSSWRLYAVMAHEIGHHLQGHTIESGGSHPKTELEADNYAGFILAGLGGSLEEALILWQGLSKSGSRTHPPREQRLQAVTTGWQRWHLLMAKVRRPVVAPQPDSAVNSSQYLLPHSYYLSVEQRDINHFSRDNIRLARNEIYARHGYEFNSLELQRYFKQYAWYQPHTKKVQLNVTERENVAFLLASERRQQSAPQVQTHTVVGEYLMPDSSRRYLTAQELSHYSRKKLRLIRNEIFARHGYVFNSADLNRHFLDQSWYRGKGKSVTLSKIEQNNVNLIKRLEK